jgi:zinc protease
VLDEVRKIRDEGVSEEELSIAKDAAIDSFPGRFPDEAAVAATYANDEYVGRPPDFWIRYRERVKALTKEDIQRVAREYVDPSKLAVLVVGDLEAIRKGDEKRPAAFDAFGTVRELPLPDPETLERPSTTPSGT